MKPGDSLDAEDPMPCVFCRGTIYIVARSPRLGLIHTAPACKMFLRLEVTEFLAAAIAARKRT